MLKNLLFIGAFPPPYHGANIDNMNLVAHWNSSNIKLSVLDISNHDKTFFEFGGKITKGNVLATLKGLKKLLFSLKSWNYDYVLFHLSQGILGIFKESLFIYIIKIFTKSKIICRFPGGDFLRFYTNIGFMKKVFVRQVLKMIDLILTEGDIVNSQFCKINNIINVKSAHIGIPDHGIINYKIPGERFEILYICYHCKKKGFWDVLHTIPSIIEKNPDIFFNFVGELVFRKNEKEVINKFISNNSLNNHIKFYGVKINDEKILLFRKASIQILPSYSEGLPTSIVEGLSFGLPIVASNVGVIPEVIKDGVNGFLINPGDRKKLREIILRLSRDPLLVDRISKTNRKYFLEEFTIDQFCMRIQHRIATL